MTSSLMKDRRSQHLLLFSSSRLPVFWSPYLGYWLAVLLLTAAPVAAQQYYVYVAAESEDEVNVVRFDGEAAEVVERIRVGMWPTEIEGPHGITISPDGAYWYVSLAHGTPFGTVHKFSTATNEEVGQVELGLFPATMALSPATDLLYVVNFNLHGHMEPSSVSIVETETMTEVARTETGTMPHGSRVSPDGMHHYSVAMMSGELYEIDALSFDVTRTLKTSASMDHAMHGNDSMHGDGGDDAPKPTWVEPHPSKPLLYVANNGIDEVIEVNTEDWTIARRFATAKAPYNIAISPDGSHLVVTHKGDASIGVWDLEKGVEQARLANTRRVTHGVVISSDGQYAFVSAEGIGGEPGAVDVFDLNTLQRVATAETGKQAGGIAFWKIEE